VLVWGAEQCKGVTANLIKIRGTASEGKKGRKLQYERFFAAEMFLLGKEDRKTPGHSSPKNLKGLVKWKKKMKSSRTQKNKNRQRNTKKLAVSKTTECDKKTWGLILWKEGQWHFGLRRLSVALLNSDRERRTPAGSISRKRLKTGRPKEKKMIARRFTGGERARDASSTERRVSRSRPQRFRREPKKKEDATDVRNGY